MKPIRYAAFLILILGVALSVYVRLAPADPALWNVDIASADPLGAGWCSDVIETVPQGARAACLIAPKSRATQPADILAALSTYAETRPRTRVLAGSPEALRMTWESRSLIMGYPDYITAQVSQTASGIRLDIFSRQRFGSGDFGVNAARLKDWLSIKALADL